MRVTRSCDDVEAGDDFRRFEKNRRDEHARRAIVDRGGDAVRNRVGRPRGNLDDGEPFFGEAIELPSNRVKLAIGRDECRSRDERQRRQESRDELVRVLAERDVAIRIVEETPKARLDARRLSLGVLPLLVNVFRRVEPRALLRLESYVGPGLMRVACEEQTLADAESGIVAREIYSCDRISHRSGNNGRPMVSRRYVAPEDPPVPRFAPMVRSTIFT